MVGTHFSCDARVFHGIYTPEPGFVVGYAAIIHALNLRMPLPARISFVSERNRAEQLEQWIVYPNRYLPDDRPEISRIQALYHHFIFALKYEGVDLLFFSQVAQVLPDKELIDMLLIEPTGQYSRRIWFLLEWVSGRELDLKLDLRKRNYVDAIDPKQQFSLESGTTLARHKVINNLPGTPAFCPLIRRTDRIVEAMANLPQSLQSRILKDYHPDLLRRSAAFLLLKDSQASFSIEGESPGSRRAALWGQAIGHAGSYPLSKDELIRLQQMVIEDDRFIKMGWRDQGGFVGLHDREHGTPIPDHISARWEDVEDLVDGLLNTYKLQTESGYPPVHSAAVIAFGFVFIHPFVDGNGRIHRYLIHHILSERRFSPQGMIFPISASILDHLNDYKRVLEQYSLPLLKWIEWESTKDNNVKVLNETADYYRFFDATNMTEFLFDCLEDTMNRIIPNEVNYLKQRDAFKEDVDAIVDLPDRLVDLLLQFLRQNDGHLSQRAKGKEFSKLSDSEVEELERIYQNIFDAKR